MLTPEGKMTREEEIKLCEDAVAHFQELLEAVEDTPDNEPLFSVTGDGWYLGDMRSAKTSLRKNIAYNSERLAELQADNLKSPCDLDKS